MIGANKFLTLQLAAGIQDRLVFDTAGHDMTTFVPKCVRGPLDGKIVGFGCARGPDYFTRVRIDQRGNLRTRLFHAGTCLPARRM